MIPMVWNIQNRQSVETKPIGEWLPRGRKAGKWWRPGTGFVLGVMKIDCGDDDTTLWLYWKVVNCTLYMGGLYGIWIYLNKAVFQRFTDLCSSKTGKASEEVALELLLLLAQSSQIVNRWYFAEHLWARHCVRHFTITTSLIPHKNFMTNRFNRWRNWSTEALGDLPQVTQLINSKTGIQFQVFHFKACALHRWDTLNIIPCLISESLIFPRSGRWPKARWGWAQP